MLIMMMVMTKTTTKMMSRVPTLTAMHFRLCTTLYKFLLARKVAVLDRPIEAE